MFVLFLPAARTYFKKPDILVSFNVDNQFTLTKKFIAGFSLSKITGQLEFKLLLSMGVNGFPLRHLAVTGGELINSFNLTHTKTTIHLGKDSNNRDSYAMLHKGISDECFKTNLATIKATNTYKNWRQLIISYDLMTSSAEKLIVAAETSVVYSEPGKAFSKAKIEIISGELFRSNPAELYRFANRAKYFGYTINQYLNFLHSLSDQTKTEITTNFKCHIQTTATNYFKQTGGKFTSETGLDDYH